MYSSGHVHVCILYVSKKMILYPPWQNRLNRWAKFWKLLSALHKVTGGWCLSQVAWQPGQVVMLVSLWTVGGSQNTQREPMQTQEIMQTPRQAPTRLKIEPRTLLLSLKVRVWRKLTDHYRPLFRTPVGKWHFIEKSQHLSRWQTGGRMEDWIKDREITPLEPGDLCQRALVCQPHSMHKYQRKNPTRTGERVQMLTCSISSILYVSLSPYSCLLSSMHAASLHPPASVSETDLGIGAGPQGSCLDWISNQCYTSCVLALAIFNTQGEAPPGGKSELSGCVGRSMGDAIIRVLGERLDSQKMDDGLSQCFNFKVIRYSWVAWECGINMKTEQDVISFLLRKVFNMFACQGVNIWLFRTGCPGELHLCSALNIRAVTIHLPRVSRLCKQQHHLGNDQDKKLLGANTFILITWLVRVLMSGWIERPDRLVVGGKRISGLQGERIREDVGPLH